MNWDYDTKFAAQDAAHFRCGSMATTTWHRINRSLIGLTLIWLLCAVQTVSAFYNPATGRWLSRDPIGEEGGYNPYGFVANDPVSQSDVLGLDILRRNKIAIPPEDQPPGYLPPEKPVSWVAKVGEFGADFYSSRCLLVLRMNVNVETGDPGDARTRRRLLGYLKEWEKAMPQYFTGWKLQSSAPNCPSNCSCPDGISVVINITFNGDYPHGFPVLVYQGYGSTTQNQWFLMDAGVSARPYRHVAHEIGHGFGLPIGRPEEYPPIDPLFKGYYDVPEDYRESLMGRGMKLLTRLKEGITQNADVDSKLPCPPYVVVDTP